MGINIDEFKRWNYRHYEIRRYNNIGKLVLREESINIINTCAPQVGLDDATKLCFWEDVLNPKMILRILKY